MTSIIIYLMCHCITTIADEGSLQDLCYVTSGIDELVVYPNGGTFISGKGDASLEFPQGAVKNKTSFCCAIFLDGLFVFPTGYKPASVVIYLNMDRAILLKPTQLTLSHWQRREETDSTLKFLTAPHTLQEGQAYYVFEEQKLVDFTTCSNAGIVSIQEPQCLHCIARGEESLTQYNAISFCKYAESGRILNFRVQFMCNSAEWNEVRITVLLRCS